jgi:hypothetical protein
MPVGLFQEDKMSNFFITHFVRTMFVFTSRERAIIQAQTFLEKYLMLANGLTLEAGQRSVEVPPMPGVDEDMRRWSFYMILEHNMIVNRSISAIIRQLARNEPLSGAAIIDPKKDVMPSQTAGEEQLGLFRDSVNEHMEMVKGIGKLRGTKTKAHMIFGDFDAHKWNCMFSFHLKIHYNQAKHVVNAVKTGR